MAFGKKLKSLLLEKGVSSAELSRRTGIPKTTLSGMFKADVDKISIDLFLQICDALNVDPDEFYREYKRNKPKKPKIELTDDEMHLIELFRELTPKEQGNIVGRAELLAEQHREAIIEDVS